MPYTAEISKSNPACFLLLVELSQRISEPWEQSEDSIGMTSAELICRSVNEMLENLILRSSKGYGVSGFFDVAVIGYTTSTEGAPVVRSLAPEKLAGTSFVSISEWAAHPLEIVVEERYLDDGCGGSIATPIKRPVWIRPVAALAAPQCAALEYCADLAEEWMADHPSSFPPITIHYTAGESSDGDPAVVAKRLRKLSTEDGKLLLFHSYWSARSKFSAVFPSDGTELPDAASRRFFEMSSELPEPMLMAARGMEFAVKAGARGIAVNWDFGSLIQFLDVGTRAAPYQ